MCLCWPLSGHISLAQKALGAPIPAAEHPASQILETSARDSLWDPTRGDQSYNQSQKMHQAQESTLGNQCTTISLELTAEHIMASTQILPKKLLFLFLMLSKALWPLKDLRDVWWVWWRQFPWFLFLLWQAIIVFGDMCPPLTQKR